MGRRRQLRNAPIVEAVMDIQFLGVTRTLRDLESLLDGYLAEGLAKRYTHQHEFAATIHPGGDNPPVPTDVSSQLESIAVVAPDKSRLVILRRDRITVSRLKSYTDWDELWGEFSIAVERYVAAAHPAGAKRIAARFINRIPPRAGLVSFEHVLERPPQPVLKDGLDGARITNFLRRHVVEGIDGGLTANLAIATVVAEPGEDTSHIPPILLDIDVSKVGDLPLDLAQLRLEFDFIRSAKNALFFGSLTDACLEQFE